MAENKSSLKLARHLQKKFFCERLKREVTYNECLDLFLFSTTLKPAKKGVQEIATEAACNQCPLGAKNRKFFAGLAIETEQSQP